jgi:hypothetical protein
VDSEIACSNNGEVMRRPKPAPRREQFPPGLAILRPEFEAKDIDVRGECASGIPAAANTPLLRPQFPPPDWEEEAKEAYDRERQASVEREPT